MDLAVDLTVDLAVDLELCLESYCFCKSIAEFTQRRGGIGR